MHHYYIGLNDKDTKKQEISTEQALKIINKIILSEQDGLTFIICNGVFRHEDDVQVCEVTIKVSLLDSLSVGAIILLKQELNQECIMEEETPSGIAFR